MSEFPADPPPPPLMSLAYETPQPHGNASLLVRLAAIFNLVLAGFDLFFGISLIALAGFMYYLITHTPPAAAPPPGVLPPPAPPSPLLFGAIYGIPGLLSLLVIPFKIIGGVKLVRRGKHVWGWGLAVGIIDCCELWIVMPCCVALVFPLATGIYTIVILCLPHVRLYLNTNNLRE